MAYGAVDRRVWHDEKFRSWDRDTREIWLYLLTCPHGNRIGCFVLDRYYAASDLQMPPERVEAGLAELEEAGRIVWDEDARVICIRRHLHPDYNPLANESVAKAAAKDINELPDSPKCFRALLEAVEEWGRSHYTPFTEALRHRVRDGVGHHAGEGGRQGVPHQEQDQDHEQDHDDTTPSRAGARGGRARGSKLSRYLNGHGDAVEAMEGSADHPDTWKLAVWGQYGPEGTWAEVWEGIPEEERPRLLATALHRFAGEGERYDNRLFKRYLERVADDYREHGELTETATAEDDFVPAELGG